MTRRFVLVGQKADAAGEFLLDDLPGTSGRLDLLLRGIRAAMLTSHGIRRDAIVYLVLLGGPRAPRVVRLDGVAVRFLRPDERSLAVLLKKVLASDADHTAVGFVPVRPGISIANASFEAVLADAPRATAFLLEESASDVRGRADVGAGDVLFVIGDHIGLPAAIVDQAAAAGAVRIAVGPTSIHADDVVAVLTNELDRREAHWSE